MQLASLWMAEDAERIVVGDKPALGKTLGGEGKLLPTYVQI